MRIEQPPLPLPDRQVQPLPLPTGSFEAVLDAAEAQVPQRAAGFSELGMFGRTGATVGTARPPHVPAPGAAPLPAARPELASLPEDSVRAPASAGRDTGTGNSSARGADARMGAPAPSGQHMIQGDGDDSIAPAKLEAGGAVRRPAGSLASSAQAAFQRRAAERGLGGGVSLLVFDEDGAAEVAVAAARLDEEEMLRLRAEIGALLEEFGLTLSDLKINGEPHFARPHADGDDHGTRTDRR